MWSSRIPALAACLLLAGCTEDPTPQPEVRVEDDAQRLNVLIFDIDSLRAERLSATHEGELIAPNIHALAQRGVSFTHMVAQASWTQPSVTSMLTGRYPPAIEQHRKSELSWLPEGTRSLPEILGYYGYTSTAVWGQTLPQLFPELNRGLDHTYGADEDVKYEYGVWVSDWIEHHAQEPFFLLVHELDLHCPQPPVPDSFIEPYAEPQPRHRSPCLHNLARNLPQGLPRDQAEAAVVGHYDGALAFYDQQVGAAMGALEAAGLLERTVVVVTADHGEDLYEHGSPTHGLLWDTVLRVPLIVVEPGGTVGLERHALVQTVDLAPTILGWAGVPLDEGMVGSSLAPLLEPGDPDWPDRDVYSITNSRSASIRTQRYKLFTDEIRRPPKRRERGAHTEPQEPERRVRLFDLEEDPREKNDISETQPEIAAELLERLEAWMKENATPTTDVPGLQMGDAQRKKLQDGGYWEIVGGDKQEGKDGPAAQPARPEGRPPPPPGQQRGGAQPPPQQTPQRP